MRKISNKSINNTFNGDLETSIGNYNSLNKISSNKILNLDFNEKEKDSNCLKKEKSKHKNSFSSEISHNSIKSISKQFSKNIFSSHPDKLTDINMGYNEMNYDEDLEEFYKVKVDFLDTKEQKLDKWVEKNFMSELKNTSSTNRLIHSLSSNFITNFTKGKNINVKDLPPKILPELQEYFLIAISFKNFLNNDNNKETINKEQISLEDLNLNKKYPFIIEKTIKKKKIQFKLQKNETYKFEVYHSLRLLQEIKSKVDSKKFQSKIGKIPLKILVADYDNKNLKLKEFSGKPSDLEEKNIHCFSKYKTTINTNHNICKKIWNGNEYEQQEKSKLFFIVDEFLQKIKDSELKLNDDLVLQYLFYRNFNFKDALDEITFGNETFLCFLRHYYSKLSS